MTQTIETWKNLHNKLYFGKHRLYKKFDTEIPKLVEVKDIKNKVVVEIGGGYGRNTTFFAKHAKMVYMIEVSEKILQMAALFIRRHNCYNVKFLSTDTYDTAIPYGIDYVYESLVFQHIEPTLTKKYIDDMYEKLNVGGIFNMQFRLGKNKNYYPKNLEPTVYHKRDDVIAYFDKFKIEHIEEKKHGRSKHLYVIAKKL